MTKKFKYLLAINIISLIFLNTFSSADSHNISQLLETIQKDLKTLEKAVYSNASGNDLNISSSMDQNSEEVLTRHLLKLSEIESQFQELTNKFEEINFKLDKLSNRISKTQADNQLRFQQLENKNINLDVDKNIIAKAKEEDQVLPGSSQPQDLGSISYKDTDTGNENQEIQSIETTNTVVTETFVSEEKVLPEGTPNEKYEFATSFLKVGDYNMA